MNYITWNYITYAVEDCLQLGHKCPCLELPTTRQTSDLPPMGVMVLQMGEKLQPFCGKMQPMRVQMPPVEVNVLSGQLSQSVDGTG